MSKTQQHLDSVNETYGEHFVMASGFGIKLILGGLACLVHGVFPSLFERTGSTLVSQLHQSMVEKRIRQARPSAVTDTEFSR